MKKSIMKKIDDNNLSKKEILSELQFMLANQISEPRSLVKALKKMRKREYIKEQKMVNK